MKNFRAAALVLVLSSTTAFAQSEIPVERVILSTSGLANFVHRAPVDGNGKVEFPVRLNQVDDILKSLVVFDKKGQLGGVTLPGKQPLQQVFKDLPFTQAQLSNPMLLLNAYQGAVVTLQDGKTPITGKLVRVVAETAIVGDDKQVTKHRISIMTDQGMKQALLEDLQSLQFDDPKIRTEIARALDAIRENGTAERRVLEVSLHGEGKRDVTLSYVVDAPLWKSAYRMVIPSDKKTGLLQGWAVVENMTAADWKNIDLTLVSGNPVTFKQALYQSYYVERPEIPVQVFGRVMPRADQGALSTAEEMEGRAKRREMGALMKSAPAAAPMMAQESFATAGAMADMAYGGAPAMEMDASSIAQVANAAQSTEATTQVLFRFPNRFDLKSGQSMMVPFVSRDVPMERVSLYQPDTHATHPLAAVEMKNDGDSGLPPGVLTIYEESDLLKGTAFVGDAQLPVLAAGEKRMVSYALDTKVTINREDKHINREGKITVSQGILKTAMKNRAETAYTIKAPEKEERIVVIEHPKMGGYEIVTPDPKEVEVTNSHYRVRIPVKAGEKKTFGIVLENEGWQSYAISGMPADTLIAYASGNNGLDAATKKTFEKLAALRREMDAIDGRINVLDQERNVIFQDQERVRQNLDSLDDKSEVQEKYLKKLNEQEDRVTVIDAEKNALAKERAKKQAELQEMIAEISF